MLGNLLACYGLRTPNRHHGNALRAKIPTTALGERFERALVADPFNPFNEHSLRSILGSMGRGRASSMSAPYQA